MGRVTTRKNIKRRMPHLHDVGSPSPWRMPLWQTRFFVLLTGMVTLTLCLRLAYLDTLQNEIYGDIAIVYRYVERILQGEWPIGFVLSAGPLYHYVIAPIIALTGLNYAGLKLASVIVSMGVLATTYLLARRLIDDRFALLTTCIAGISSWLLIFSRLGNSQILLPLLSTAALWLVVRIIQEGRRSDVAWCAVVATLGLYTYPQSFILPGVIFVTLVCLNWMGLRVRWADLRLFLLVSVLGALPFVAIVLIDLENFTTGYVGGKIQPSGHPMLILFWNSIHALLAFHVRGDVVFRSNPQQFPHLDPVSGILFLIGVVFWLMPTRRCWSPLLLIPLLLLQIPSILVLSFPVEVPSASRTLAVAPIAYLLVASGFWWLLHAMRRFFAPYSIMIMGGLILSLLVMINAQRYFQDYLGGLPYHNTPIGHDIAVYADMLPPDHHIYIVGEKWHDKMPEFSAIEYAMASPQRLHHLKDSAEVTCEHLTTLEQPAVLIWSFHEQLPAPQLRPCQAWFSPHVYTSDNGWPVFKATPLQYDRDIPTDPLAASTLRRAELPEYGMALLNGHMVGVFHSALDLGNPSHLFDNNPQTLIRGNDSNPLVIEIHFDQPYGVSHLDMQLATMPYVQIQVELLTSDGNVTNSVHTYRDLLPDPQISIRLFDQPQRIRSVRIAVWDLSPREDAGYSIHVREVSIQ